jgi:P27 family predicted phage terminase small subunit
MKGGHNRKPAARQIAEGDPAKRGVHRLETMLEAEPKAQRGLPKCPKHLKGRAREQWRFWVRELEIMNIDRRPDAAMLEGACVAYDAAVRAYETLEQQGPLIAKKVIEPATGKLVVVDVKTHPAVRQRNQAWALVRSFCSEFGLSPVSRARLAVEKSEDTTDADLMALLTQPREKRTVRPIDEVLQ